MQDHDDFDFEDRPGIPAPLPPGEHVVWQGSPNKWELAKNAFHLRKVIVYFLIILTAQMTSHWGEPQLIASLSFTSLLALFGILILAGLAWITAHVTIYTVTNRRILIRFGVALQMTINLPLTQIKAADMRCYGKGFGDIPLTLKDTKRVNYIVLWPHVRPWCFSKPQPMIRSIPNVKRVAEQIAQVAAESPTIKMVSQQATKNHGLTDSPLMQSEAL